LAVDLFQLLQALAGFGGGKVTLYVFIAMIFAAGILLATGVLDDGMKGAATGAQMTAYVVGFILLVPQHVRGADRIRRRDRFARRGLHQRRAARLLRRRGEVGDQRVFVSSSASM
jgi:uncharacterized membrane protein